MILLPPDDTQAAWAALSEAGWAAGKALRQPRTKARRQLQRVLDDLLELKRTQSFEWYSEAQHRRWFEALNSYIDRAKQLIEAFGPEKTNV